MATRMVRHALAASCLIITISSAPASADGIRSSSCVFTAGMSNCVSYWRRGGGGGQYLPWQVDVKQTAASEERERKWLARCRPVATEDSLGISRYRYAAKGCEFGKVDD